MDHITDWERLRKFTAFPTYRRLKWDMYRHPLDIPQFTQELAAAGLVVERSTTFLNFYLTEPLVRCRPR